MWFRIYFTNWYSVVRVVSGAEHSEGSDYRRTERLAHRLRRRAGVDWVWDAGARRRALADGPKELVLRKHV
jgi:hypothetical protein